MIRTMRNQVPEVDLALLDPDAFTFSVLKRILRTVCETTITDDANFILCLSNQGYPVWIWTKDGIDPETLEEVRRITLEEWPPAQYHFNIKYEAADYFMARSGDLKLLMNMMTYECQQPVPPAPVPGRAVPCAEKDLDLLVEWLLAFQEEVGIDKRPAEEHRKGLKEKIGEQSLYFWLNEEEQPVCLCGFRASRENLLSSLGPVFTPPEERRKHYAENLVHAVTCEVLNRGLKPILYTNADYEASNGCYQKVGFRLKGTLCTIGKSL